MSIESLKNCVEKSRSYANWVELLRASVESVTVEGLFLEFGVYEGVTTNIIAKYTPVLYGFDSFLGLPEEWNAANEKGRFNRSGNPPVLPPNVHLAKGWFQETLPVFVSEHLEPIAFVHIDCDLYSSAKTVLTNLKDRFVNGTVLNFNEFLGYEGCEQHEIKAFDEFLKENSFDCRCIGKTSGGYSQAAFALIKK